MDGSVRIALEGGPEEIDRLVQFPSREVGNRIKIEHRNGYEHFVATGEETEIDGETLAIFRWCDRTFIAE